MEGDEGGERGDVDDAPVATLEHVTAEDLAGAQSSGEVGLEDFVPLLVRHVEGRPALDATGAVDEDVHLAERGDDLSERDLQGRPVSDVATDAQRSLTQGLDLGGCGLDLVDASGSRDTARAALGNSTGERKADPRGSTHHHRHSAGEAQAGKAHCGLACPCVSMRSLISSPLLNWPRARPFSSPRIRWPGCRRSRTSELVQAQM